MITATQQCCQVLAREINQIRFEISHFLAAFSALKIGSDCRFLRRYCDTNGTPELLKLFEKDIFLFSYERKKNKYQAALECGAFLTQLD
jgi:hypothetical protein